MSLRATTDSIDDYGRTHLFEIYDSEFSGTASSLKNTGQGYASFSHQKIDPKKPWENPVQKGALELSLWLESSSLIDDIKGGDEQQFYVIHKIDGTQEWQGYVYNDLTTYEEGFDGHPFRITLMAKDFTDLGGKDFLVSGSLPDSREEVIQTIATLLNEVGFSIPIKTHTSWIEENLEGSIAGDYDYLNHIFHDTKALRKFGRTGDEADQPITVEEALNKLCINHELILKQTDGAYWIDQLPAYEDPTSVKETEYDIAGAKQSLTTGNDMTVGANTDDLKVVIKEDNRDNSGAPGIKRVTNTYNHRTQVSNIQFPDTISLDTNDTETAFAQVFLSDGDQSIDLNGLVRAVVQSGGGPNVNSNIKIRAGTSGGTEYWWNGTSWQTSIFTLEDDLVHQGGDVYSSNVSYSTTDIPPDADGQIEITFTIADDPDGFSIASTTEYKFFEFTLNNPIAQENSTSIDYQLTQSGIFSVTPEIEETWFGDGPLGYSPGALRYSAADGDTTTDTWQRGGSTAYRNFHENLLKGQMDLRRGWRRMLSALLKGKYKPSQVLSYDNEYFYYLGGTQDIFTGNWTVEIFRLNVVTGTDTFDDIPKFADEAGGTGSSGGGSGAGLTISDLDPRYVNIDGDTMSGALDMGDNNISNVARLLATEVEIDGDWQLRSQTPGSVNRLFVDPITADSNAEIFVAPSGTATSAALTLADGPNQTNYEGIEIAADELTNRITSLTEGTGTIRELQIRVDGNEDLSLWRNSTKYIDLVSGGVTISQPLTAQAGIKIGSPDASISGRSLIADQEILVEDSASLTATASDRRRAIELYVADNTDPTKGRLDVVNTVGTTVDAQLTVGIAQNDDTVIDVVRFEDDKIVALQNVGINNDTPADQLEVTGTARISKIGATGTRTTLSMESGNFELTRAGTGGIDFAIDGSGNVVLGAGGNVRAANSLMVNTTSLTPDFIADFNGDVLVRDNLRVQGGLFAKTFTVDTTRVFLSSRFGSGGIVGEIVDSTVGAEVIKFIDEDGNAIVPFADNDLMLIQQRTGVNSGTIVKRIKRKVVADGQPSNEVSLTTTGVTTGTDTGTIAVGDHAVLDGNTTNTARDSFIAVDVLDRDIAAFGFIDNQTDFGNGSEVMRVGGMAPGGSNEYDSALTGDIGIAGKIGGTLAFALTEDEGLIGNWQFGTNRIYNISSNEGIELDATNQAINLKVDVSGSSETTLQMNPTADITAKSTPTFFTDSKADFTVSTGTSSSASGTSATSTPSDSEFVIVLNFDWTAANSENLAVGVVTFQLQGYDGSTWNTITSVREENVSNSNNTSGSKEFTDFPASYNQYRLRIFITHTSGDSNDLQIDASNIVFTQNQPVTLLSEKGVERKYATGIIERKSDFYGGITLHAGKIVSEHDLYLETEGGFGTVISETIRDDTTGISSNVVIQTTGGRLQRSTSARKYKEEIRDLSNRYTNSLSVIKGLRPRIFRNINDRAEHIGLVADEVDKVLPEVVGYVDDEPDWIQYDKIVAPLIGAVQELTKEVEKIKARLSTGS